MSQDGLVFNDRNQPIYVACPKILRGVSLQSLENDLLHNLLKAYRMPAALPALVKACCLSSIAVAVPQLLGEKGVSDQVITAMA